jgi:tetratricopeptide (TPR) repeat protein
MDKHSVTNDQNAKPKHSALSPFLRKVLAIMFAVFAIMMMNSAYLLSITLLEQTTGRDLQGYFYLLMFLFHLGVGLIAVVPVLLYGPLHFRRARHHSNENAKSAGILLFIGAVSLLLTGVILARFGFLEVDDPLIQGGVYWVHIATPILLIWLFIMHRLDGTPIRWKKAGMWAGATVAFVVASVITHLFIHTQPPSTDEEPYSPAFVKVTDRQGVHRKNIPPQHLMDDENCAECHPDIAQQANLSMHRFSSFNNPAYRFSIEKTRDIIQHRDGNMEATRLCAACHDPVPLLSGAFDHPDFNADEDETSQAGITCLVCHAITDVNSPRGNADYTITDPPRYPFALTDNPFLKAINHQLIKAKPAFHKKTFLKPVHKSAEFCSTCHKAHIPTQLNQYRWKRGQNHYDSFLQSGISGHRVDSFYYPDKAVNKCADCHMPAIVSDDPAARKRQAAKDTSVHNHLFPGGNTGVPHMTEMPPEANAIREEFLRRAARVDLFGIKENGEINGELHAALGDELPVLKPGKRYLLETVVRTLQIGHHLTQGTSDSNELWLDVTVKSGDNLIGRSGGRNAANEVDPWSYFINSYILDHQGKRIEQRDAQNMLVALYDHQIPPGAASIVHYQMDIPSETTEPISIEVKLQYRKFNSAFMRHMNKEDYNGNDLPIITLASNKITLPVKADSDLAHKSAQYIAAWERWNDYGIGLLRESSKDPAKGELRQAEMAFKKVESLGYATGSLNLARVYVKEGRLDEASEALSRALKRNAPAWTIAWFSALIDREHGNLDTAIQGLNNILQNRFAKARKRGFDFSYDLQVINTLGRTQFERAHQTRNQDKQRFEWLEKTIATFQRSLDIDPENVEAHHNLALAYAETGDTEQSKLHHELHQKYRHDDRATERAVALHRSQNPAADHAAEAIVIYKLQQNQAYSFDQEARVASSKLTTY